MAAAQSKLYKGFFVISGTHGVGKSTTLELVAYQLNGSGHSVRSFHHRFKGQNNKVSIPKKSLKPSPYFGIRRAWRCLPKDVRLTIVALLDAYNYAKKIARKIKSIHESGNLALADRYVYDQLIDLSLRKHPFRNILAFGLASRIMTRPTLTIVLTDQPERIHSRNPELTISQNAKYQDTLIQLLGSRKIPYQEVSVFDRTPKEVANEVSHIIINHILCHSVTE